jgi:hypothetical protein
MHREIAISTMKLVQDVLLPTVHLGDNVANVHALHRILGVPIRD